MRAIYTCKCLILGHTKWDLNKHSRSNYRGGGGGGVCCTPSKPATSSWCLHAIYDNRILTQNRKSVIEHIHKHTYVKIYTMKLLHHLYEMHVMTRYVVASILFQFKIWLSNYTYIQIHK